MQDGRIATFRDAEDMYKFAALMTAALLPLSLANAHRGPMPMPVPTTDAVHSYILLDRTGSMSGIWEEALGSVNAYATQIGKDDADEDKTDKITTNVTLAVFDHQDGLQFDVLREGVESGAWTPVTNDEAAPRGMTPLFDAINQMVALAEKDAPEKAVIVVMTDGMENASREVTKDGAKAALDRARARGWEVVFLGAEFASFGDAQGVGMRSDKTMAISAGSMQQSMQGLARKSRAYGKGEEAEVTFDDADRSTAGEQDVIDRKGPSNQR